MDEKINGKIRKKIVNNCGNGNGQGEEVRSKKERKETEQKAERGK